MTQFTIVTAGIPANIGGDTRASALTRGEP
jgi:hypothetical protein